MSAASPLAALDASVDRTLGRLRRLVRETDTRPFRGRVARVTGTIIHAHVPDVRLGELCELRDPKGGSSLAAEVVGLSGDGALLTPIGDLAGLSTRTEVVATGRFLQVPVGPELLGRVVDSLGRPLDGRPLETASAYPVHNAPPPPLARALIDRPMPLGIRVLDGLLTCGEGQRIGVFGEPGGGKSTLLASIVKGAGADVAVVALIGERGREVREFVEHSLGPDGLARSVLVVATSDRPAMERVKAGFVATSIAEYFRDQGRRVLLLMDSVTRLARAQREIGLAAGEPPTRRGFPPSVFAVLPRLMERSGPAPTGSITAFYAVLVEGDGTADPIGEEARSILDGHVVLSERLGASGHHPAVDVLASRSRVMGRVADADHKRRAARLRELLAKYEEIELLIQVGEYRPGSDALADEAVEKIGAIRAFLRQDADEATDFTATLAALERLAP